MILQPDDVMRLLETPANGGAIAECLRHEQRLRLHAVPHVAENSRPAGWAYLRERFRPLLPPDRFAIWEQCVPAPLPTTDIVEDIFTGLQRVFEAQDSLVQCQLVSPELETDFDLFRTTQNEADFWEKDCFAAIGSEPHSLLVIDMPAVQAGRYPEPYTLLLGLPDVWDVVLKADGSCEYVVFIQPSYKDAAGRTVERMHVYDDAAYAVWEKREGESTWQQTLLNPHVLGFCPARLLWSEPLDKATQLARKAPLTAVLGALDRFVWWDAAIEYYRLYGTFPMIWGFESECQYREGETSCQGGVITRISGYDTLLSGEQVPRYQAADCPACAKKLGLGPGVYVEVPAPSIDMPDTREPIGFVTPSVDVLNYLEAVQAARRQQLLRSVLGGGGEPMRSEQALNEKQVRAGFEIKQDVLMALKKPIQEARAWELTTKGKLRYGPAAYRSTFVNLGQQFYLKSPEQLALDEIEARKAGRPVYELSQLREDRYHTLYRHNPAQLDRMRILSDLEPYPEYSVDQILTMISTGAPGLFDTQLLRLKVDFGRYLTHFESEQLDVRRFASLQPYHTKLDLITQILLSYVPDPNSQEVGIG